MEMSMYTSTTVRHYRLKWRHGDFLGVSFDEGSHDDNWLPETERTALRRLWSATTVYSTADVSPIHQHADAGCACSRCTYSRSPYYRAPCGSSGHASDAHRGCRSSYPGLCGSN